MNYPYYFMSRVLEILHIKFTSTYLFNIIKDTPNLYSMFGVSWVLSKYNIDSKCIKFENKDDILNCHLNIGIVIFIGSFYIIKDISEAGCTLISERKTERISLEELYRGWNGVIMVVKSNTDSGEPNYNKNRRAELSNKAKSYGRAVMIALILGLVCIANFALFTIPIIGVIIVNILGIGVSYLLLQKQLHIPNRFADKLCGLAKESHCEDVTQSEGANFLGMFKLSEIGMAFFSVNFIFLMVCPEWSSALALYGAIVLPFSFWSIWYQKYRAKSWCVLCLLTLSLMWTQAIIYYLGGIYEWTNKIVGPMLMIGISYGVTVIIINQIMTLLENRAQTDLWKREYLNLKYQDFVINSFVEKTMKYNVSSELCSSLIFGNPNSGTKITIFSNPYCSPCAKMHKQIEMYPGKNLCVQYVMTSFSEEKSIINRFIIAAYQKLGAEKTWELLSQWHEGGKAKGADFFTPFNLDISTESILHEFDKQNKWRSQQTLKGTPTIMINGNVIDYPYDVTDYFLFTT